MVSAAAWNADPTARQTCLLLAQRDPVFFINELAWTYDPREPTPFMPFDLFPAQEAAVRWIADLADRGVSGVLDKSRDTGASWLCAAYAVWLWLFRPGVAIGFGSRKLEYVDKPGDPKCMFDKLRTIVYNLPPWLMNAQAPGFDRSKHDHYCKMVNPASGANITGEGGDNIGRGGRTSVYFVDESAYLWRPLLIDQALTANTRCRIDVSTPRGGNNPFAVRRHSGRFPTFTLHWRDDPRRTAWAIVPETWEGRIDTDGEMDLGDNVASYGLTDPPEPPPGHRLIHPWYEEIRLKEDPVTVAQEYDIDYSASLEGVIIPARWLRACVGLVLPAGVPVAGFDVAGGGSAYNAYIERHGPVVTRIVKWREGEDAQTAAFDAAVKVLSMAESGKVSRVCYDAVGVGAGAGPAFKAARRPFGFSWIAVNVGARPTNAVWPDRMKSTEKFANLKAELWWRLRARAERTFQHVEHGVPSAPEDMLSLPHVQETEALIGQLSNVRYFEQESGKIIIESKAQLADRGVASPDLADALVLSYGPASSRAPTRSGDARSVQPGALRPRRQ